MEAAKDFPSATCLGTDAFALAVKRTFFETGGLFPREAHLLDISQSLSDSRSL